jgi:hypothetical protein
MRRRKRMPGESNAGYEKRDTDPNLQFLGIQSSASMGDPTWALRAFRAFFAWRDRRRESRS